jgi:monoamine oxidase
LKKDLQVEINTPVQNVDYPLDSDETTRGDELVRITTKEGIEYQAKNVVITASPHVIQNKLITFSPPLPDEISDAYHWVKMNSITKVIMKFKKPVWPRDLHGMIMTDDAFLLPEIWFRNVEDEVAEGEEATAYAVGFTTSKYQERVAQLSQEEVFTLCLAQLEQIFSKLEPRHMSADPNDPKNEQALKELPKPRDAFLGGMFWDWRPSHHPYIGGGYCSPIAGKPITIGKFRLCCVLSLITYFSLLIGQVLKKGNGNHMFFAGEATNHRPGATAHAALETGIRAADQVAAVLKANNGK